MTRKQLWNMKHALPRTSFTFLAIGIAAAGFFATPSAFAGAKEAAAIQTALDAIAPPGDTIQTATAANLSTATLAAIDDPANKKLSPTSIAGEALRGAGDDNFGTVFGSAAFASGSTRISDKPKFAGGAAVSASTGKTANPTLVPDFAAQFAATNDEAQTIANFAKKSTTAIGAVLGGRAQEVSAAERINLANTALVTKQTKKAAQQIAQYVSDPSANDTEAALFAVTVAVANKSFIQKVAVGTTISNPDAADLIIDGLFVSSASADALKIAPKLAKGVGVVADIEQIQLMAISFGGKVSSKQANSTAKALIQGISARDPKSAANGPGELSLVNKADEVGEVAAYFLAALERDNTAVQGTFTNAKSAANLVFKLVKTMFKAAKIKTIKGTQTSKDLQNQLLALQGNFAASIGFTLANMGLDPAVLQAITDKLNKSAKSIAGGANATTLQAQFTAGFTGTPANGFESGVDLGNMIDPETDFRNG
jgi:hypothetical protein